ncbi:MAG: hypothetical protein E7458_07680 [Ruminococcaceae bacterium]|nr:hypothetical protein [Oscillospiraceae bacterium]
MKTRTRVLALLLAVCLFVTMLSGCATKPYVMMIDDVKIRQGIYGYYYGYNYYNYFENYGESTVQYYTITSLFQHVAIYKLFERNGMKLTAEDEAYIEDMRAARIEALGGQAGYAAFLKTIGLTDKLHREILAISPMYTQLFEYYFGEGGSEYITEEEVRQIYSDLYAHEAHIFISTENVETVEDRDALRAKADEAHARAVAGEDFSALIKEYGDDEYMAAHPEDGYYLAQGDSGSDVIDEALFNLGIDEISEVVETEAGFFIYKRLPVQESYLDSVFENGTAYATYVEMEFSNFLMDEMIQYDPEYLQAYYEVDFTQAASAFAYLASVNSAATTGTTTDAAAAQ